MGTELGVGPYSLARILEADPRPWSQLLPGFAADLEGLLVVVDEVCEATVRWSAKNFAGNRGVANHRRLMVYPADLRWSRTRDGRLLATQPLEAERPVEPTNVIEPPAPPAKEEAVSSVTVTVEAGPGISVSAGQPSVGVITLQTKSCTGCNEVRHLEKFQRLRNGKPANLCRDCMRIRMSAGHLASARMAKKPMPAPVIPPESPVLRIVTFWPDISGLLPDRAPVAQCWCATLHPASVECDHTFWPPAEPPPPSDPEPEPVLRGPADYVRRVHQLRDKVADLKAAWALLAQQNKDLVVEVRALKATVEQQDQALDEAIAALEDSVA